MVIAKFCTCLAPGLNYCKVHDEVQPFYPEHPVTPLVVGNAWRDVNGRNAQMSDRGELHTISLAHCEYCGALPGDYCMTMGGSRSRIAYQTHNPRRRLAFKVQKQIDEGGIMSVTNKVFADAAKVAMRQRERKAAMGRKETLEARLQTILRGAEASAIRIEEELARLESRPAEPVTDDPDNANVVWFKISFGGGKPYTYAGVNHVFGPRPDDSKWFLTGVTQSRRGYTWDELMDWIETNGKLVGQIWHASEWEDLG